MKLFCTPQMQSLAQEINLGSSDCIFTRFSDGELCVRVNDEVGGETVWVVATLNPPAEHLIEMLLLLDALQRAGARVNLLITYFGYERQDNASNGEPSSAKVMAQCLSQFKFEQLYIVHNHSAILHQYLNFIPLIPTTLMVDYARGVRASVIVAPDDGAHVLARDVAVQTSAQVAYCRKERSGHDTVYMKELIGCVAGRRVLLIDDMISTGQTVMQAAQLLRDAGAVWIGVMVTHMLGTRDTVDAILTHSPIDELAVTNSIPRADLGGATVISIAPLIRNILQQYTMQINHDSTSYIAQ